MPTDVTSARPLSPSLWLIGSLVLAFVVQVFLVSTSPVISRDGITFIDLARGLDVRPVETMRLADQHPGYPAMILAARHLVRPFVDADSVFSWIWGARIVSGAFGLGVVVLTWLLAKRAFNNTTVAGVGTLGVAVIELFRRNASDVLSDTPHLFFYVLAAWLALEGLTRRRVRWFAGVGLASAAAFWIRPEGLSVAMVIALVLPFYAWRRRDFPMRTALWSVLAIVVTVTLSVMPYVVVSGKLTSKVTSKPHLMDEEEDARAPGVEVVDDATFDLGDGLAADAATDKEELTGVRFVLRALRMVWRKTAQGVRYAMMVPFFLGLLVPSRERSGIPSRVVAAALITCQACLLLWLYYAGRYISTRHVMPIVALMVPWVAEGTILMARGPARLFARTHPERREQIEKIFIALLMLIMAASLLPRTLSPLNGEQMDVVNTSLALGHLAKPDDQIVTNSVYVMFYAHMPGRLIGAEAPAEMMVPDELGPPFRFVVLDVDVDPLDARWTDRIAHLYEPTEVPGVRCERLRVLRLKPGLHPGR